MSKTNYFEIIRENNVNTYNESTQQLIQLARSVISAKGSLSSKINETYKKRNDFYHNLISAEFALYYAMKIKAELLKYSKSSNISDELSDKKLLDDITELQNTLILYNSNASISDTYKSTILEKLSQASDVLYEDLYNTANKYLGLEMENGEIKPKSNVFVSTSNNKDMKVKISYFSDASNNIPVDVLTSGDILTNSLYANIEITPENSTSIIKQNGTESYPLILTNENFNNAISNKTSTNVKYYKMIHDIGFEDYTDRNNNRHVLRNKEVNIRFNLDGGDKVCYIPDCTKLFLMGDIKNVTFVLDSEVQSTKHVTEITIAEGTKLTNCTFRINHNNYSDEDLENLINVIGGMTESEDGTISGTILKDVVVSSNIGVIKKVKLNASIGIGGTRPYFEINSTSASFNTTLEVKEDNLLIIKAVEFLPRSTSQLPPEYFGADEVINISDNLESLSNNLISKIGSLEMTFSNKNNIITPSSLSGNFKYTKDDEEFIIYINSKDFKLDETRELNVLETGLTTLYDLKNRIYKFLSDDNGFDNLYTKIENLKTYIENLSNQNLLNSQKESHTINALYEDRTNLETYLSGNDGNYDNSLMTEIDGKFTDIITNVGVISEIDDPVRRNTYVINAQVDTEELINLCENLIAGLASGLIELNKFVDDYLLFIQPNNKIAEDMKKSLFILDDALENSEFKLRKLRTFKEWNSGTLRDFCKDGIYFFIDLYIVQELGINMLMKSLTSDDEVSVNLKKLSDAAIIRGINKELFNIPNLNINNSDYINSKNELIRNGIKISYEPEYEYINPLVSEIVQGLDETNNIDIKPILNYTMSMDDYKLKNIYQMYFIRYIFKDKTSKGIANRINRLNDAFKSTTTNFRTLLANYYFMDLIMTINVINSSENINNKISIPNSTFNILNISEDKSIVDDKFDLLKKYIEVYQYNNPSSVATAIKIIKDVTNDNVEGNEFISYIYNNSEYVDETYMNSINIKENIDRILNDMKERFPGIISFNS